MNREFGSFVDEEVVEEEVVEEELEPVMGLEYLVEVTDKDGKVLQRISALSRSFVRQWYDVMSAHCDNANRTVKDTGGANRAGAPHENSWYAKAVAGEYRYGHRVGKGTTAVTISDYALESPIDEGVGLDQLEHGAVSYAKPAVDGSTCSFWIRRSMLNSSGSTITGIKEIGIYTRFSVYYMLGVRDVLPSEVYIPNGGAITVTYTFKVTV